MLIENIQSPCIYLLYIPGSLWLFLEKGSNRIYRAHPHTHIAHGLPLSYTIVETIHKDPKYSP